MARSFFFLCLTGLVFGLISSAQAQQKLCPSGDALEMKIASEYASGKAAFLERAYPTLLFARMGESFWSVPYNQQGITPQRTIQRAYENGMVGFPKNAKTAKRIEKYIGEDGRAEAGEKRSKKVPITPPQSAIDTAARDLSCRYVPNHELESAKTEMLRSRAADLADRPVCRLGTDLAKAELETVSRYNNNKNAGAVGVINWAMQGQRYWTSYIPFNSRSSSARDGVKDVLKNGAWDATAGPIPPDSTLYETVLGLSPVAKQFEKHDRSSLPENAKYPSGELIAWAEDRLNCRLEVDGFAQARIMNEKTLMSDEAAEKNAARETRLAEIKRESDRIDGLRSARWPEPPASRNEPRGGVKPGGFGLDKDGWLPEICAGYFNGLSEKPVLTDFERRWGAWYHYYKSPGTRCRNRPVERYYTVAEREQQALRAIEAEKEAARIRREIDVLERQKANGGAPSTATNSGIGPAPATPFGNSERDRENWEKYKENQRCSNPTATGC